MLGLLHKSLITSWSVLTSRNTTQVVLQPFDKPSGPIHQQRQHI